MRLILLKGCDGAETDGFGFAGGGANTALGAGFFAGLVGLILLVVVAAILGFIVTGFAGSGAFSAIAGCASAAKTAPDENEAEIAAAGAGSDKIAFNRSRSV